MLGNRQLTTINSSRSACIIVMSLPLFQPLHYAQQASRQKISKPMAHSGSTR